MNIDGRTKKALDPAHILAQSTKIVGGTAEQVSSAYSQESHVSIQLTSELSPLELGPLQLPLIKHFRVGQHSLGDPWSHPRHLIRCLTKEAMVSEMLVAAELRKVQEWAYRGDDSIWSFCGSDHLCDEVA